MKRLLELWKWKLIITIICTLFFTLPIITNWPNVDSQTIIFVYLVMPILIWISVTYSLVEYGKNLNKDKHV